MQKICTIPRGAKNHFHAVEWDFFAHLPEGFETISLQNYSRLEGAAWLYVYNVALSREFYFDMPR